MSVNVGSVREVTVKSRQLQTGIYKLPVSERIPVSFLGLRGDVRVEPRKMGEEQHAVYAYPYEHYGYWEETLGREPFPMGQFGENLTVTGLLEEKVRIGDVFRFGNTVLQVAQPRIPCGKLNERMGMRFAPAFLASRKVGYYLRVIEEGDVGVDDCIELLERDDASPTMEEFVRIVQYEYWDDEGLSRLLGARDLMPAWREIIEAKLLRTQSQPGWHGLRELEVAGREEESENIVSLYLSCYRGRPLAPFQAGQHISVVLGSRGSSSDQRRRSYAISSAPEDLSCYRISVARIRAAENDADRQAVSDFLTSLNTGDRVLCSSPHGSAELCPGDDGRIPVLLSEGIGIAPMISILHALEQRKSPAVHLFHSRGAHDPRSLISEAVLLTAGNDGYSMTQVDDSARLNVEMIASQVALDLADFHIAGPRDFVDRIVAELRSTGVPATALQVERYG